MEVTIIEMHELIKATQQELYDEIIKELDARIALTNTLPDQQLALKSFREWVNQSRRTSKENEE